MRQVKSRDTAPELALRKALWSEGFRYKLYSSALPGRPDIVFSSAKVVVFVDGDFWHGNQWRRRGLSSLEDQFKGTRNAETYWIPKIKRTVRRDSEVNDELGSLGWKVVRVWESDLKRELDKCVDRVAAAVKKGKKKNA